jgi:hypothetical protein
LLCRPHRFTASELANQVRVLDTHYDTIRIAMRGVFQELGLAA